MHKPLVSIIIPVYNGSNFVAEAIKSALAQTYKNLEVIVVNDGSRDDGATDKVVSRYAGKIVYVKKENGGISSALNTGIRTMRGEYFSWLSHDDLYEPDKIKKQVAAVGQKDDIILCSGWLMNEHRQRIRHRTRLVGKTLNGEGLFKEFLHGYVLNGLGFLVPKSVFDKVGLFDESMRYLQDLDMWMRMMMGDYRFICIAEELVISRIHAAQTTNLLADCFDKDRASLAIKHIRLIDGANIPNKNRLLFLYLKLFVKGSNKVGENLIKAELKKNGYSNSKLWFSILPFYAYGQFKQLERKAIHLYFKVKGVRK